MLLEESNRDPSSRQLKALPTNLFLLHEMAPIRLHFLSGPLTFRIIYTPKLICHRTLQPRLWGVFNEHKSSEMKVHTMVFKKEKKTLARNKKWPGWVCQWRRIDVSLCLKKITRHEPSVPPTQTQTAADNTKRKMEELKMSSHLNC